MYGRWCLHAQWWGYFNKMKVYFIIWFKLKMYKQKVELNLKKKKVPEIFRKNWRKISGNFPENFQFFRGNFPAHITTINNGRVFLRFYAVSHATPRQNPFFKSSPPGCRDWGSVLFWGRREGFWGVATLAPRLSPPSRDVNKRMAGKDV